MGILIRQETSAKAPLRREIDAEAPERYKMNNEEAKTNNTYETI
ncbi:MAG: hypothetical protein AAFP08_07315 [Bacteroidota bacterium]